MDLRGSLGRSLQHTLLRYEDGHQCPFVEKWELDWAVADPVEYRHRRKSSWLREEWGTSPTMDGFRPRRALAAPTQVGSPQGETRRGCMDGPTVSRPRHVAHLP